jgi:hypothetical protein
MPITLYIIECNYLLITYLRRIAGETGGERLELEKLLPHAFRLLPHGLHVEQSKLDINNGYQSQRKKFPRQ